MPSFAYPDIVVYPAVGVRPPSTSSTPQSKVSVSTQLRSAYPHFDICTLVKLYSTTILLTYISTSDPAGYPENVYNIYPCMGLDVASPVSVKLPAQYPTMEICMCTLLYLILENNH